MTTTQLTVVDFKPDGTFDSTAVCDAAELNPEHVEFFSNHLQHLSHDLELPLEGKLPVNSEYIEYRIGSESNDAAFVLYYHHDENVCVSLFVRGEDEDAEYELMQIMRCLLLSSDFEEDLGEDEIDVILDDERFDFEQIEARPALFNVSFWADEDKEAIEHVREMDRHLAIAFFNRKNS